MTFPVHQNNELKFPTDLHFFLINSIVSFGGMVICSQGVNMEIFGNVRNGFSKVSWIIIKKLIPLRSQRTK